MAVDTNLDLVPDSLTGKLETYATDELIIYEKLGITDVEGMRDRLYKLRRNNEKNSKTEQRYEEYWVSVDDILIRRLQSIYTADIDMFDYPDWPLQNRTKY
mgnify:CR=1 FL=1